MTERKPFAPMFVRSHEEAEPNAHGVRAVYRDAERTLPPRQPVPPFGLHRVQAVGGYDWLADEADNADSRP